MSNDIVDLDQPWRRVKEPLLIPTQVSVGMLQQWDDAHLAQLMRCNLMPRDPSRQARVLWEQLWQVLRTDEIVDRALEGLDVMITRTEDAIDTLDATQQKRARKFLEQADMAWTRVSRIGPRSGAAREPLGWAGRAGEFSLGAQKVIARLIDAIDEHRATQTGSVARQEDRQLWSVLRQVGLDPRDYPDAANWSRRH